MPQKRINHTLTPSQVANRDAGNWHVADNPNAPARKPVPSRASREAAGRAAIQKRASGK